MFRASISSMLKGTLPRSSGLGVGASAHCRIFWDPSCCPSPTGSAVCTALGRAMQWESQGKVCSSVALKSLGPKITLCPKPWIFKEQMRRWATLSSG